MQVAVLGVAMCVGALQVLHGETSSAETKKELPVMVMRCATSPECVDFVLHIAYGWGEYPLL
eukprot:4613281-Prymnesium_polylepis.1